MTKPASPEDKANIFSIVTHSWLFQQLLTGYKNPLNIENLYPLSDRLKAEVVAAEFKKNWLELKNGQEKPSVTKALFKSLGKEFLISGLNRFTGDMLIVFSPIVMLSIIEFINANYFQIKPIPPLWTGYVLVVALLIMQILQTLFINMSFAQSMRIGFLMRIALISAVYEKSLVLSSLARQQFSAGKIVNIMSTDISRLDFSMQFIHYSWSAPAQMVVASGLLIWQLGPSALVGIGIILLSIPFQLWTGKQMALKRNLIANESDQRVKITQEILQGIKVIKLNAWEDSFLDLIEKIRAKELVSVRTVLTLRAIVAGFLQTVPILALIFSLIVFVDTGGVLTASRAFTSLALFYVLRIPLLVYPTVISQIADCKIALRRCQEILTAGELDSNPDIIKDPSKNFAIKVSDANFIWEKLDKAEQPTSKEESEEVSSSDSNNVFKGLNNINFSVPKGKLVAVVGKVGSGKSSLLNAVIGEMKRISGRVEINGSLAYCSQNAWIQNMTLRENILFGQPLDENKYAETIKCCALESDLSVLPAGDGTEIGEKGVNLSGGQKQRVNLARAVYSEADIIVLDDPLSAVDAHVGSYLFKECIRGKLKDKSVFLVTHRIHVLPDCDYMLVMDNGNIVEQGTFDELVTKKTSGVLFDMMKDVELSSQDGENDVPKEHKKPVEIKTDKDAPKQKVMKLILKEGLLRGQVATKIYIDYASYSGGFFMYTFIVLLLVLSQCSRIINDYWINIWEKHMVHGWNQPQYQLMYGGLGLIQSFFMVVSGVVFSISSYIGSKMIHDIALRQVIASPMSWFDSQPLGRIVNRFSRDVDILDSLLPDALRVFSFTFSMTIAILAFISAVFPLFLAPMLPLLVVYYITQSFYRKSSVELKRLDNVTRSPLYGHFSETLYGSGLATIRAYGVQKTFNENTKKLLDDNNQAYYLSIQTQRWLSLRLESIAALLVFFCGLFGILTKDKINPGLTGLAITYALQVSFVFNWCIKQATEVEMYMSSVERLLDYIQNLEDEEAPPKSIESSQQKEKNIELQAVKVSNNPPPPDWVSKGQISFKDVVMRYRDDLPDVLRGVSFEIQAGTKVGIIGRTAAGKSSLIQALFRLTPLQAGSIIIDGIDTSTIKKQDVRKAIAIIPQDPVIFSGTLRDNIDPLHLHTDEEITECLKHCGLSSAVDPKLGLSMEVSEGGENWSTGQRQLICLARAMLRKLKVLVLDEATASIDLQTDAFIQKSLRENFKDVTIITIAHRLNTIMDYDKIIVMAYGKVIEEGTPDELIKNKGVFYNMAVDQGVVSH